MVNFRNEYIEVERGQLLTSKKQLKKIFGWTRRHLDNLLNALEKAEMLTYRVTHRYIVITIVNYDKYQGSIEESDIQSDTQVTPRRHTEDIQVSTNKNVKNDKNVKKEDTLSSKCALIIEHLNKKTHSHYGSTNKSTIDLIRARFNEGRTVKDFLTVIDKKVESWLTDDKMVMYLRPSTLFNRTKFENYLNEPEKDKYAKYLKEE
jgi:uncharacterized phage protein (TIGR02220 family)